MVATGGKILHGSKDNIGPRVGFAYRVNDRMSVRGGFGITYDNWAAIIQMTQNYQGSWPDTGTLQINNTNRRVRSIPRRRIPLPQNGGNLPAATPFGSSNVNYMVDPRWKNPYSEQYNLGIEQQFGDRTILSLNYVGSASHRMDVGGYYNTGTPADAASRSPRGRQRTTGSPILILFRKSPGTTVRRAHPTTRCRRRWCGSSVQASDTRSPIRGARR